MGKLKYQFFLPYEPPRKWTLLDTLFWLSCEKIPISQFDCDGVEFRESPEVFMEHMEWFGEICLGKLTRNDNRRLKMPLPEPDVIEDKLIKNHGKSFKREASVRSSQNQNLSKSQEFKNRYRSLRNHMRSYRQKWETLNADRLDYWKLRLIISLREGKISAESVGVASGENPLEVRSDIIVDHQSLARAFSEISSQHWLSFNISWTECILRGQSEDFYALRFNANDVLSLFPPSKSKTSQLHLQGDFLHTTERLGINLHVPSGGTPGKYDWQAIDVKITECLVKEGGLINPQDALVKEIEDWHLKEYDRIIPRSTVADGLKFFYASTFLKNLSDN